jgi:endonuclease YncB( thermonuclease family)
MSKFIRFWKKDFLNKIIVLVVLLIAAAFAVDAFLLVKNRFTGKDLLAGFFPTPTTELKVILTNNAATVEYKAAMATASVPPTITTMPITPRPSPTASSLPVTTPETIVATSTPTQTLGLSCIPAEQIQKGKVVQIVDGYTIKVLIDGLVYTVRYLGIDLPADEGFAGQASLANDKLVYGKEITLVSDKPDKDPLGRLLRYVTVEDTFVNLELLQQGLASIQNTDPLITCAETFQQAEQSARDAQRGFWKFAAEP